MITRFRDDLTLWLLKPPYDGVIWLAWLYVVWACLYAGGGPLAGDLVWFDDRVRLVQIFNWLNGQNWYDRTIMRANLPDGFHTIWSRAVDLPVAGVIAAFQTYVGQMRAGMIAATLIPLLQVLLLFGAASYFTRPLIGRRHAKLVTLFVLFTSSINPEAFTLAGFQVGMIGHHSWYVLLTLMLFGALSRLVLLSSTPSILIAAFSIGGLLLVGIEGLPLIAGASAVLAFIGWFQNRPRLIHDALRVTALGAFCGFALLPANQPPDKLLSISFAEPSILGPIFVLAAAAFFAGQGFVLRRWGHRRYLSFSATALCAALLAALLIYTFPDLLNGGTAALSPEEHKLALAEHQEAMTLFRLARNNLDYLRMIMPPLLAVLFALYRIKNAPSRRQKAVATFHLGLVALTFALASIYSRYFHYVGLTSSPWLLMFWLTATQRLALNSFFALKSFALYVALGPLWLWLVPAANFNQNFFSGVLLFPAKLQTEPQLCDTKHFTEFLNARYGADKTIIVPMYTSDKFLLHTNLQIFFVANFPSGNKFIDAKAFYETGSPDEAHRIVAQHGINLAALCTAAYKVTQHSELTNRLLRGHMHFGQMLVTGQAPDWLKPVEITGSTSWLLYEVVR